MGDPLGLGSFGFSGGQEITISWQPFEFHQENDPIVIEHLWTSRPVTSTFYIGDLHDLAWSTHTYLTHNQKKKFTPNWDYSILTVKGPLNLFRPSSFASFLSVSAPFISVKPGTWDKAATCVSTTCAWISNLLQIHVLEYLIFHKYSCLFLWEKQCCQCPAFMPKWNSLEKYYVKHLSNRGITEEDCQLVWALLLWNFFRMASLQPQADVVTTPVLGQTDKSTLLMCCWPLFLVFCLQKKFSLFLHSRDKFLPVAFTVLKSIFLEYFLPL